MKNAERGRRLRLTNSGWKESSTQKLLCVRLGSFTSTKVQSNFVNPVAVENEKIVVSRNRQRPDARLPCRMTQLDAKAEGFEGYSCKEGPIPFLSGIRYNDAIGARTPRSAHLNVM